jgi:hypothetical protein
VAGKETIVFQHRVRERNLKSGLFEPLKKQSTPVAADSPRRSFESWDGEYLYVVEVTTNKNIQAQYAFNLDSAYGPHWFWREPASLSGSYRFLAAYGRKLLIQEDGQKNSQNMPVARFHLWDLDSGSTKTILERENSRSNIVASAALRDYSLILVINDGSIFQLDNDFSTILELKSNFWPDLSELYIQSLVGPKGETINFPPHFRGDAFFDTTGSMYFAMQVREKNHWDSQAIASFWDSLKPAERDWMITNGKWPIAAGSFDGSDDVAVILKIDTDNKVSRVPESAFSTFLERDPYTHQWRWSTNHAFSLIGTDAEGKFVPIETLLIEDGEKGTRQTNTPSIDKKTEIQTRTNVENTRPKS